MKLTMRKWMAASALLAASGLGMWGVAAPLAGSAAHAAAPFLLIHGEQDALVPIDQSERMARALRRLNKPVQFLRVRNAGHDLGSPGQADRRRQRWLLRSLGGRQWGHRRSRRPFP